MINIPLLNSTIELPDCWEELSFKQRITTFALLSELLAGSITPQMARLKMLIEYTGYRPSFSKLVNEAIREDVEQRETINLNLLRLSEMLNFAFTVDGNRIIPNLNFKRNPVSYIMIDEKKYFGRRFEVDINCRTNISAREFSDCFDLITFMSRTSLEAERDNAMNQVCGILFPAHDDYGANNVSGHHNRMKQVYHYIKFGVVLWFTGIVKYYTEHPVYSILFRGEKDESHGEKIRFGMNDITLTLKKEGYGDPERTNLNDYFDAQVKYLKDNIHKAIASGAKEADISNKTGIPLDVIYKLV